MDAGKVTMPTLFNLSTVFDTIDYTILLRRLDDWFGATGKALNRFKSYLTGRCQRIKSGDCLFSKVDLAFGISLGSDLGPLFFTLYTTPLSSMISGHAIPHHLYAVWMSMNKLKLNPDKTAFLLIGNKRQGGKYHSMFPIERSGVKTYPAKSARNLGVMFDTNFNF